MATDTLFGRSELSFGPCNVYWDTATGGANTSLGTFDQLVLRKNITKIGLREAQAGARDADRAISSQVYQLEFGMARPTAERLGLVQQGFEIDYDTGNVIKQIYLSDLVGQLDSEIWKQVTVKEILSGVEATEAANPLHILDLWKVAPMTESVELTYDAENQRFYGVLLEAYKSDDHPDHNGKATYGATRIAA